MADQTTDMVTSALLGFRREQLVRSARPLRSARRRRGGAGSARRNQPTEA